jgi:hypothetical protein
MLHKFLLFCIFSLLSTFLLHCIGGETINEKSSNRTATVYYENGSPANGATVVIADTSGKSESYITNRVGQYQIPSKESGEYRIYISVKINEKIFASSQDSVFISPDSVAVKDDTLKPTSTIVGYVSLEKQHRKRLIDVIVHLRGTELSANVDSNGRFIFNGVAKHTSYNAMIQPPDGIKGYTNLYPKTWKIINQDTLNIDTIKFPYSGIPTVNNLKIDYDSLQGIVKLQWDSTTYNNFLEYIILRQLLNTSRTVIDTLNPRQSNRYDDVLFSLNPGANQNPYTTTATFNYRYTVLIRGRNYQLSELFINPLDTIATFSPKRYETSVEIISMSDSATQLPSKFATVNNSLRLVLQISNAHVGVKSFTYLHSDSSTEIKSVVMPTPTDSISDTIYIKPSQPGFFTFHIIAITDSTRFLKTTKTIQIPAVNFNLTMGKLTTTPVKILKGSKFNIDTDIYCSSTSNLEKIPLSLYAKIDDVVITRIDTTIDHLNFIDTIHIHIDSTRLKIDNFINVPGLHTLQFVIDPANLLQETNELDNIATDSISILDCDLIVSKIVLNPPNPLPGENVALQAYIKNIGTTATDANVTIKTVFFINNKLFFTNSTQEQILPGDSLLVFGVPTGTSSTPYWNAIEGLNHEIRVVTDTTNAVAEVNEKNNSNKYSFNVTNIDLEVTKFTVDSISRLTPQIFDAKIKYKLDINRPVKLLFLLNNDTIFSKDTILQSYSTDSLLSIQFSNKGDSSLFTDSNTVFIAKAIVDPGNSIRESNETNNIITQEIKLNDFYINGTMSRHSGNEISGWFQRSCFPSCKDSTFQWERNNGINNSDCISITANDTSANDTSGYDIYWTYPLPNLITGKKYKLSGYIKGENIKVKQEDGLVGANLCIDNRSFYHTPNTLIGTFDWTYVEMFYTVPNPLPQDPIIGISCRLGYYGSTASGKAYFDNIRFELLN